MNNLVELGALDRRLTGLQRPAEARLSSGLCRAVAERYGLDPMVVRVATVIAAFVAGIGLVLYGWGTLLTPKVGHQAPIRRILPSFERWSAKTQVMVILASSLLVVISSAGTAGAPIGPIVILGVLVLVARRGNKFSPVPTPTTWTDTPPDSVEAWRDRIRQHSSIRSQSAKLPTVDLYGTTPASAPAASREQLPVSWLGAILIVSLGAFVGFASAFFGLGDDGVLMAMAACTLTVGGSMTLWALLVRSRRLPALLIVVALAGGAVTAANAVAMGNRTPLPDAVVVETTSSAVPEEIVDLGIERHEFIAAGEAVVDLRDIAPNEVIEVRVEAVASSVRILLPGNPAEFVQDGFASSFTEVDGREPVAEDTRITLVVEAVMSRVEVEYW